MLAQTVEYALRAVIHLADHAPSPRTTDQIAAGTLVPEANAVERLGRIRQCPLGLTAHGVRLCPLHKRLDNALAMVEDAFRQTTLAEILADTRPGAGRGPGSQAMPSAGIARSVRPRAKAPCSSLAAATRQALTAQWRRSTSSRRRLLPRRSLMSRKARMSLMETPSADAVVAGAPSAAAGLPRLRPLRREDLPCFLRMEL
jgi:DNA-binding IscR family transcriptional regulator